MTRIAMANKTIFVERHRFVQALAARGIALVKPAPRKHFFTTEAGTAALCDGLFQIGAGWLFAANGDVYVSIPARAGRLPERQSARAGKGRAA